MMTVANLKVGGKDYVVIPKRDFDRLSKPRPAATKGRKLPSAQTYSDETVAEFLLNNACGPADYKAACRAVRELGLDPAKIDHVKPHGRTR